MWSLFKSINELKQNGVLRHPEEKLEKEVTEVASADRKMEELSNQLVNIKQWSRSAVLCVHFSFVQLRCKSKKKNSEKRTLLKKKRTSLWQLYLSNHKWCDPLFDQMDWFGWNYVGCLLRGRERSKLLCHFYRRCHYFHSVFAWYQVISSGGSFEPPPKRSMVGHPSGAPLWCFGDRLTANIFVGQRRAAFRNVFTSVCSKSIF